MQKTSFDLKQNKQKSGFDGTCWPRGIVEQFEQYEASVSKHVVIDRLMIRLLFYFKVQRTITLAIKA